MGLLARKIGPEKTETFFLDIFTKLCNDNVKFIRKSCADIFPIMCNVLGLQITEKELVI